MSILKDAFVIYDETFIPLEKADNYFKAFNNLPDWKYSTYNGGLLNRQTCVFADDEILNNKKTIPPIWGKDVSVKKWPSELLELKSLVEDKVYEITGKRWIYNIALGNKYTKAKDFISFHSDNEEYGSTQSIASISLGIPRTFTYINKANQEKLSLILKHGSLIFMGENCQENYTHGMKKEATSKLTDIKTIEKYDKTRINITFRVWSTNY